MHEILLVSCGVIIGVWGTLLAGLLAAAKMQAPSPGDTGE